MLMPTSRSPAPASSSSLLGPRDTAATGLRVTSETTQRRLDDWVKAFAARLAWLGAQEAPGDLARLGLAMYEHYDLLDPYDVARRVWRRRPADRRVATPRAAG